MRGLRFGRVGLGVSLGLVLVPVAAFAGVSHGSAVHVRVGGTPRRPKGSTVVGTVPAGTPMRITVALKPRNAAALAHYATSVSTPGSRLYHRYLGVSAFRQRFGPSDAQIHAVEASLKAHGLVPRSVSKNGLLISVSASAGQISHAFSISLNRVRLANGRVAFANAHAPQFDASVAPLVQAVVGLDSLSAPQPLSTSPQVVTGGPQPCSAAVGGTRTYTADQLASAYGFPSFYGTGNEGAGSTIALYELGDPNLPSDIAAYQACYGTNATVNYIQVDGGGAGTAPFSSEDTLDIEDVIGLAPQATVDVYQAPDSFDGSIDELNRIVADNQAQVLSISYGTCEEFTGPYTMGLENTIFQEAAVQGMSVFAASGDAGSRACAQLGFVSDLSVSDPASQPYVTSVGGTALLSLGPPPTERTWNDGTIGASGGGMSNTWGMPGYQINTPGVIGIHSSGAPCGAASRFYCREVPDVSADASPLLSAYRIFYNGSWANFGGTSAAAPLWAAFTALADSSSTCNGTPVGFATPVLYNAAATDPANFNDVTTGNNDIPQNDPGWPSQPPTGLYPATTGYDMATGLGTPTAALATALCGGAGSHIVTVTNPGAQTSVAFAPVHLQVSASDSNNAPLTYTATGLPPGLTIGTQTGLISGAPTIPGAYDVTVTAADYSGAQGTTAFYYQVDGPDLSIGLSATPSSPIPVYKGNTLTYTITVTNTGDLPADGVTVTDPLPSSVKFISMPSNCTRTLQSGIPKTYGGTITCTNVAGLNTYGDTATIAIAVTPTTTGTLSNTASVTGTGILVDGDDTTTSLILVKAPYPQWNNSWVGTTMSNISIQGGGGEVVALTGSRVRVTLNYSIIDSGCPGCEDQIEVGWNDQGPAQCIYDGNPGSAGASGSAAFSLTAPTTPGIYYLAYDEGGDYGCGATLPIPGSSWFNGNPPGPNHQIIGRVIVRSSLVGGSAVDKYSTVKISGVKVNGKGDDVAVTAGSTVNVSLNYAISDTTCLGCHDQIEVGINNAAGPSQCIYDGTPGSGATGTATFSLTAPSTKGSYFIAFDRASDTSCLSSTSDWWNHTPQANPHPGLAGQTQFIAHLRVN